MPQEILGIGILSTAHPGHAASYTRALAAMAGVKLVAVYEQDVTRGRAFANHFGIPNDSRAMRVRPRQHAGLGAYHRA